MLETKKFNLSPSASIIVAGVLIAGAIVYINRYPNTNAAAVAAAGDAALPASISVSAPSASDHVVGSLQAPIVLIEYSDFQCPFCALVHPTLKKIVEESNGEVAWIMRNFPLESIHPNARPAALAGECIAEQLGSEGWFKFADDLFADQKNNLNPAHYVALAQSLGTDMAKYNLCMVAQKYGGKLDDETAEAMANGGQGTPFTVVYGYGVQVPIPGALPYEQFQAVIKAVEARQ